MREIKFRGKRKDTDEWVYGNVKLSANAKVAAISENWYGYIEVRPDTIGQFTGLHDKNGKEIYEGDVILQRGYSRIRPMLVRFEHGAFVTREHSGSSTTTRPMLIQKRCEVLGNIYDSPELLKGGEE